MQAALQDDELIVQDLVHEPVFLVDATGPSAGKLVPQRFRFANTLKGMA